jgi:mediator of RNA polymerase II transcription subunit 10
MVPPEIINYVQEGRNPDIYTREFVELIMRYNQKLKGKTEAFAAFRDVFARELVGAVPELRGDVKRVIENTGGALDE